MPRCYKNLHKLLVCDCVRKYLFFFFLLLWYMLYKKMLVQSQDFYSYSDPQYARTQYVHLWKHKAGRMLTRLWGETLFFTVETIQWNIDEHGWATECVFLTKISVRQWCSSSFRSGPTLNPGPLTLNADWKISGSTAHTHIYPALHQCQEEPSTVQVNDVDV